MSDACNTLIDYIFLEYYSKVMKYLEQQLINIFEHQEPHYQIQGVERDEINPKM